MSVYMTEWSPWNAISDDETIHDGPFSTHEAADKWLDYVEEQIGDINSDIIEVPGVEGGIDEPTKDMLEFVADLA